MQNQKDIERALESAKETFESYKTDIALGNVAAENAYRRAEKIAAVLYVVTAHMDKQDAQKASLNKSVDDLLSNVARLGHGFRSDHASVSEIERAARVLGTPVKLLVASGELSRQNAEVILGALEALVGYVRQVQTSLFAERIALTKADVLPEDVHIPAPVVREPRLGTTQNTTTRKSTNAALPADPAVAIHSPRRTTILALLKKSGPLGIKDIAAHIPDCGEKTVQRELAALVTAGAIKKEGEKRWSRYSIV